jgi:uncharacterized membrane protein
VSNKINSCVDCHGKYAVPLNTTTQAGLSFFVVVAALAMVSPAQAGFTICNQTLDIANVAIGESSSGELATRGWWVIAPNRCADVISGDLKSRYVYVQAVDGRGLTLLDGKTVLCSSTRQFEVVGKDNCWQRGFTTGTFQEIDTKAAQSWTLFLRETVGTK